MIRKYKEHSPKIHESCFIADSAEIIGRVTIKENANVWFNTVMRGDHSSITIGKNTNVQDGCVLHGDRDANVNIGDNVTVGHGAIVHGCTIGNTCLIGMGSIILNKAKIGDFTIIGAGSLVTQGKEIPSGVLCMGSPAKVIRNLTEEEKQRLMYAANDYVNVSKEHKEQSK